MALKLALRVLQSTEDRPPRAFENHRRWVQVFETFCEISHQFLLAPNQEEKLRSQPRHPPKSGSPQALLLGTLNLNNLTSSAALNVCFLHCISADSLMHPPRITNVGGTPTVGWLAES